MHHLELLSASETGHLPDELIEFLLLPIVYTEDNFLKAKMFSWTFPCSHVLVFKYLGATLKEKEAFRVVSNKKNCY